MIVNRARFLLNNPQQGIHSMPLVVPVALAGFSVAIMPLLLLGQFRMLLVWSIGMAGGLLFVWPVLKYYKNDKRDTKKEQNICDSLVLTGVVIWVIVNLFFTAQHFFTNRDPGVYAITGVWLTKQNDLILPASDAFAGVSNVAPYSAGFSMDPNDSSMLVAQGNHLLPALLGTVGRIVGIANMVRINVVIGGIALLAFYSFARQLIPSKWALLATLSLSLTLPFIYFSRDVYTELLALTFTFSALAILLLAQRLRQNSLWVISGLVLGASTLARIDAYLTIAATCTFLVLWVGLAKENDRIKKAQQASLLLGGLLITSLIGFLDLKLLSPSYFISEWRNLKLEFMLISAIICFGLCFIVVAWKTKAHILLSRLNYKKIAKFVVAMIVLGSLLLASRPLWHIGYFPHDNPLYTSRPVGAGEVRDYSEQTVNWLIWYLGPLITVLGLVGFCIFTYRSIRYWDMRSIVPVLAIGCLCTVYLFKPNISPDQIWASRRFLPVIIPGIIFLSFAALTEINKIKMINKLNVSGKTIATVLATLAVISPLVVTHRVIFLREATWLAPLHAICQNIPEKSALLWVGTARTQLVEPTRAVCNMPSMGYGGVFGNEIPDQSTLASAAKQASLHGYTPVIGVFANDLDKHNSRSLGSLSRVTSYSYQELEHTLRRPPTLIEKKTNGVLLGIIDETGKVSPLSLPR